MRRGVAVVVGMMAATPAAAGALAAPAHDCNGQNGVCIAACMQYGIGHGRKQDPQPMPAEFCQKHCAAWYAGCLTSGCWNGDFLWVCGLDKK